MRYKLLGRSGLRVSELALGTMTFGEDWGWGASKEESQRIFDAFAEAGGNFIDTAVNYTNGSAEAYVGDFIQKDRDYFVVATKYTLRDNHNNKRDPNAGGNHRKRMMQEVEKSLKRLKTDYIDLYYLHMWDYYTPEEEVMRSLDDLVRAGKVRYLGISDTPAWVISKANMLAEWRGWSRFVANQFPYSLASRTPERDIIPMSRSEELAMCVWGILGGGTLTGKYREADATKRYSSASEERLTLSDKVVDLAKEYGASPAQVAINWTRQRPGHGAPMIPILGARSLAQLEDNLGALNFALTAEQVAALDALSPVELGFPHDFLRGETVMDLIYGQTYKQTDNHREFLWR
ncbi:MAG: aldo/keto reductase [Anaerolineae bacterium]|nr:MAG: aldo/keto reductase [Anaerolineae bacterium]